MSLQRVKIYSLRDGRWDDVGTGNISVDYIEDDEFGLCVIDEEDNGVLLIHQISTDVTYSMEGDSIIKWKSNNPELSAQMALSFREPATCSHVWNHISSTQVILQLGSMNSQIDLNVNSELTELPNVNLCTLSQILEIVEMGVTNQKQVTELLLSDVDFFQNLMAVFETCETSANVDGLHKIFQIVKGIILLNSSQILDIILGDQLFMKIIGCLEYNPDVRQFQHHRNYLSDQVVFREAIPIKDPLVLSKIHQTFRIGYLKDVVLKNVVDDDDISAKLKSARDANIASIITLLKNDCNIIQELFARLQSPSTSVESRNNLVDFLHEFCRLCRSLDMYQKLEILGELTTEGVFDIIAEIMQSPDKKLVLTGTDILFCLLDQDPTLLRSYFFREETPLLDLLVKGMMEDFGEKQHQFVDLVQEILECGGVQQQMMVMGILCEKQIPVLADFIAASCPGNPLNSSEDAGIRVGSHCGTTPQVLLIICEFLCVCIKKLDPDTKNSFLTRVTQKVLLLTRRKEKPVVAAAIRFLRTLLAPGDDDDVHSYIVENNMLKPIIDVFVVDGHRDNLLNSAILELLQHISKASVLLKYVVETFWDQLTPFEDQATILALKTKYDQSTFDPVDMRRNEPGPDEESSASASQDRREAKPINEKSSASASPDRGEAKPINVAASSSISPRKRSGGLVDNSDDEDDEQEENKRQRRLLDK